ncbi:hypothetical protein D7D52_23755 [Nocardia yunnanensis]|uniref:Uncharacterized protein n=1 Tax=Nocardia yunnanensis TaxID=2382165 RepID=A0A386ZFE1_9NOCA|nr:hypothetical protein [Nocardia yunnanensis]AYF76341.1 hypothetical protein D7D52_23755 [Nocardia yunnanensis]
MIASTPVANWVWGRGHEQTDTIELCLRDVLFAYEALAMHRLAIGVPVIRMQIPEAGNPQNLLLDTEFAGIEGETAGAATDRLARLARESRTTGEAGLVRSTIDCAGEIGVKPSVIVQPDLFWLSTAAFEDYVTTSLVTHSDAWMEYDLRGQPQPAVFATNQPRLAAALADVSKALAAETDPGDVTDFGQPTETGVDNFFEPDGTPSNVWHRYEE